MDRYRVTSGTVPTVDRTELGNGEMGGRGGGFLSMILDRSDQE